MARTRTRTELPEKYNESERKLGRSKTAMYREEGEDWVLVVDLNLLMEKERK
jgi:hypothetical protein